MLTNYVIAKDSRFKAATSGAGISNLLSGFGDDHYIREYMLELGTPWDNTEDWLRNSNPFFNAGKHQNSDIISCWRKRLQRSIDRL